MDGKLLARISALVFVAVAITATAIEMTRNEDGPLIRAGSPVEARAADPLRAELIRCQEIGEAGPRDPACLRAWAENRRRFLAPGARPMERLPGPPQPQTSADDIEVDPIRKQSAPVLEEGR